MDCGMRGNVESPRLSQEELDWQPEINRPDSGSWALPARQPQGTLFQIRYQVQRAAIGFVAGPDPAESDHLVKKMGSFKQSFCRFWAHGQSLEANDFGAFH